MIVALNNGLTPEQAHKSFGNLRRWAVEKRTSWPNLAAFLDRWNDWTLKDVAGIQARAGKRHFGSTSAAEVAEQAFNIEETTT